MTLPVLVVGGDGRIGRALVSALRAGGTAVLATSRRPETQEVPFDLRDPASLALATPPGACVLLAAATSTAACTADPVGTARVNVDGPIALARRLADLGTFVVFASTDHVFDGSRRDVPEDAARCPVTEYGRQKARVEEALESLGGQSAILRLGKVLEPDLPVLARWRDALGAGQPVEAFADLVCAPIPLSSAVSALRLIASARASGTFHLSADESVSYAALAAALAHAEGAPADLVRAIPAHQREPGLYLPAHATLGSVRLQQIFGVRAPSVSFTIERAVRRT